MPFNWQPNDLVPPDRVASSAPPSFGEEFSAHVDARDRTRAVDALWANQADWMDDKLNDFYQKTGQRLDNPMRLAGINDQSAVSAAEQENKDKFAKAGVPYPSQDEIAKGGLDRAIGANRLVGDLGQRPASMMGWLGGLAGDMWATSKDPINIMAMALAPGGGSVAANALRVGGAFAGGTELSNALTYGYQKQVSPDLTPAQAFIKEPLEAGAQGIVQELGIEGLGAIWRRVFHSGLEAREPLAAQDAGTVAAKAADLRAQQPFPGEHGASVHEAAIGQMERAINADDPNLARLPPEAAQLARAPAPESLVVAARMPDGEIRTGKPGQIHADLLSENDMDKVPLNDQGFVNSKGEFLTRREGHATLEQRTAEMAPEPLDQIGRTLQNHPNEEIRGIGAAMRDSSEEWAGMREAVARGEIPPHSDMTTHLSDAADAVRRSVDEGRPIMHVMDDGDKFHSDIARMAARVFYKDDEMTKLVSKGELAERLHGYVEETMRPTPGLRERMAEAAAGPQKVSDAITATALAKAATPEAIKDQTRTVASFDAAHANLERMREMGDNKYFAEENGAVVPSVIDKEMKKLDDMRSMAKALRDACNGLGEAAE